MTKSLVSDCCNAHLDYDGGVTLCMDCYQPCI